MPKCQGQKRGSDKDFLKKTENTYHSRETRPQLKQYLPLLRLLIEDVQSRAALQRAEPAEVSERGKVQVLRLGHREAPDEEVKEARVVHVYG